jgi:hypothetical protein
MVDFALEGGDFLHLCFPFSFRTITGTGSPIPPVPCQLYGKPNHKELPLSDCLRYNQYVQRYLNHTI